MNVRGHVFGWGGEGQNSMDGLSLSNACLKALRPNVLLLANEAFRRELKLK